MAKKEGDQNLLIGISLLWATLIFALGIWWLYLIFKFGAQLDKDMIRMVKWEGGTFFVLLTLLSGSLFYLYTRDQKKSRGLQSFFATMTHELKTPLASIRLQVEVLKDLFDDSKEPMIQELSTRLVEDTQKLETQMDKILQLARIERGGNLNPVSVDLRQFIASTYSNWGNGLEIKGLDKLNNTEVLVDEFAFELILRNLFENTKQHSQNTTINLSLKKEPTFYSLSYTDGGVFRGDSSRLGEMFYKHESTKGSGIGLYLIHKLIHKMSGSLKVTTDPLIFTLNLPTTKSKDHL